MSTENLRTDIATTVKGFVFANGFQDYSGMIGTNEKLEDAMREVVKARGIASSQLEKLMYFSANISELAFSYCTFEEKLDIALYTWFGLYVDETATKDSAPFVVFQQRFVRGLPQLDPVLDAYVEVLHRMCDQYHPMAANVFLNSTFEFVNATCVESALLKRPTQRRSNRYAGFLRERTGLGVAYTIMVFPKSRSVDFVTCFPALPDMDFWNTAANDLLSFYKEELSGETENYIHNRANAEGKDSLQVLSTVKDELLEASANITRLLKDTAPEALAAWSAYETGYIAFHLQLGRYQLKDLDL